MESYRIKIRLTICSFSQGFTRLRCFICSYLFFCFTQLQKLQYTANMRKLISLLFIIQSLKLFDKRGTCFRIESFKQYVYGLWSRLENSLYSKDQSIEPLKAEIIFRMVNFVVSELPVVSMHCVSTHLIYPVQVFFIQFLSTRFWLCAFEKQPLLLTILHYSLLYIL